VNALPASWLSPPHTGDVFTTITDCERRLRGFCLAEGFDIVRTGGGTRVAPDQERRVEAKAKATGTSHEGLE
jgi:hypothetical protein